VETVGGRRCGFAVPSLAALRRERATDRGKPADSPKPGRPANLAAAVSSPGCRGRQKGPAHLQPPLASPEGITQTSTVPGGEPYARWPRFIVSSSSTRSLRQEGIPTHVGILGGERKAFAPYASIAKAVPQLEGNLFGLSIGVSKAVARTFVG
jgi:hypothetical protein